MTDRNAGCPKCGGRLRAAVPLAPTTLDNRTALDVPEGLEEVEEPAAPRRPVRKQRRPEPPELPESVQKRGLSQAMTWLLIGAGVSTVALSLVVMVVAALTMSPARNAMSLRMYKVEKPAEPQTFTIQAELMSSSPPDYYRVLLVDREPFETQTVVVERDSDVGRQVFGLLKDGKEHIITVTIRPASIPGLRRDHYRIVAVRK